MFVFLFRQDVACQTYPDLEGLVDNGAMNRYFAQQDLGIKAAN